jgi:ER lumen protein retaining receptor
MNLFRLVADLLHCVSIFLLLYKMHKTRSCAGISRKSQELYLAVFVCRYLDLFLYWSGLYNTVLKLTFLGSSAAIVYLMRTKYQSTYNADDDVFRLSYAVAPCFVMALIINQRFTPFEIIWSFSIWLEAVAILPQLFMLQRRGEVETMTAHYVFSLGAYRALYLLNWTWRLLAEGRYSLISWTAGLLQTAVYGDFFYHYWQAMSRGKKLIIPQ